MAENKSVTCAENTMNFTFSLRQTQEYGDENCFFGIYPNTSVRKAQWIAEKDISTINPQHISASHFIIELGTNFPLGHFFLGRKRDSSHWSWEFHPLTPALKMFSNWSFSTNLLENIENTLEAHFSFQNIVIWIVAVFLCVCRKWINVFHHFQLPSQITVKYEKFIAEILYIFLCTWVKYQKGIFQQNMSNLLNKKKHSTNTDYLSIDTLTQVQLPFIIQT